MSFPTETKGGLDVTYVDGTTEHVDCTHYWTSETSLHTESRSTAGYQLSRGPSFPLANLRKYQAVAR